MTDVLCQTTEFSSVFLMALIICKVTKANIESRRGIYPAATINQIKSNHCIALRYTMHKQSNLQNKGPNAVKVVQVSK